MKKRNYRKVKEDNIKRGPVEVGCKQLNFGDLAQDLFMWTTFILAGNEPSDSFTAI